MYSHLLCIIYTNIILWKLIVSDQRLLIRLLNHRFMTLYFYFLITFWNWIDKVINLRWTRWGCPLRYENKKLNIKNIILLDTCIILQNVKNVCFSNFSLELLHKRYFKLKVEYNKFWPSDDLIMLPKLWNLSFFVCTIQMKHSSKIFIFRSAVKNKYKTT